MPLTAFSVSRQQELDVDQLLQLFADQHQRPKLKRSEPIPEIWKQVIHADVECPACFAKGAELVPAAPRSPGRPSNKPTSGFQVVITCSATLLLCHLGRLRKAWCSSAQLLAMVCHGQSGILYAKVFT